MASGRYKKTKKRATKRAGVKKDTRKLRDGEVREGPGGKLNVYDEETGRWYRAKKRDTAKKSDRKTTSGTVTSGKRAAKKSTKGKPQLGGENKPYKPKSKAGMRPAEENVVKGQAGKGAKPRNRPLKVEPEVKDTSKSGKKIPIGKVVLRGTPPKKYRWDGRRFVRYTGPRPASNE